MDCNISVRLIYQVSTYLAPSLEVMPAMVAHGDIAHRTILPVHELAL